MSFTIYFFITLLLNTNPQNENKISWYKKWKQQPYLTGSWFGLRTKLKNKGIVPHLHFINILGKTIEGGHKEGRVTPFLIKTGLKLDFNKLFNLKGFSFFIEGAYRGNFIKDDCLTQNAGGFQTLNELDNTRDFFNLTQIWIKQKFLNGKLEFVLEKLYPSDYVVNSKINGEFLNTSFLSIPTVPISRFRTTDEHFSTFEMSPTRQQLAPSISFVFSYKFNSRWKITNVINDQRPEEDRIWFSQVSQNKKNFSFTTQLSYSPILGNSLNGNYVLGLWYVNKTDYSNEDEENLHPHTKKFNGTMGFYFLFDQLLYKEKTQKDINSEGLYLFGQFGFAPGRWEILLYYGGGLLYKGAFPSRPNDTTGIGIGIADFSKKMEGDIDSTTGNFTPTFSMFSVETIVEWFYKIQAGNWLTVHHGLQWVRVPKGITNPENKYYEKDAFIFLVKGEFKF